RGERILHPLNVIQPSLGQRTFLFSKPDSLARPAAPNHPPDACARNERNCAQQNRDPHGSDDTTQHFDDAIDLAVVVVEVGRKTEQALARRGDDALLVEEAMQADDACLYRLWSGTDDAGARLPDGEAGRAQLVRQSLREPEDLALNLFDTDLEQQVDRGAKSVDAIRVEGACLESPRIGQEVDGRKDERSPAIDIRPAALDHRELVAMLGGREEDACAFGPAQPLVPVRREE